MTKKHAIINMREMKKILIVSSKIIFLIAVKKRGARMKIQPHFFYPISYEKPMKDNENIMPYFLKYKS